MEAKREKGPERERSAEVIPLRSARGRTPARKALPPLLLRVTLVALAVELLATWGLVVLAGEPARPGWWVGTIPLAAWVAVPFLLMALAARWLSGVRRAAWVNLVAALILPTLPALGALQLLLTSGNRLQRSYFVFAPMVVAIAYLPFLAAAILCHSRSLEQ